MGEVYRARDMKLGREVAFKVLPASVAHDPNRLARFEREARVLATLNHPGVAAIYGVEDANGVRGLVLELVEGPTLADRLMTGPLPVKDALKIAFDIAEAVEAAVKLARAATGKPNIIVFQGSFHGRTHATMAMTTSKTIYRAGYQPLVPGIFVAPFPYAYAYGWDEETAVNFCLKELKKLLKMQKKKCRICRLTMSVFCRKHV